MKILNLVAIFVAALMLSACVQTTATTGPTTTRSSGFEITFGQKDEIEVRNDTRYVVEIFQYGPNRSERPLLVLGPNGIGAIAITRFLGGTRHEQIMLTARALDPRTGQPNGCFAEARFDLRSWWYRDAGYRAWSFSVGQHMYQGRGARC